MVKKGRAMGINDPPEIKLARRILAKHSLSIPFDIERLVSTYAEIIHKEIPYEGIDGVSLNIKTPGKFPKVIVNTSLPRKRQLFTLAHELGHIIIPWHLGTIIDDIYSQSYKDFIYSQLEQEANRFAAELLMPFDWLVRNMEKCNGDYALLHSTIAISSGVSDHAAAIRLTDTLPQNIIYVAVKSGFVLHSGCTAKTHAFPQKAIEIFNENPYPYVDSHTKYQTNSCCYHWWKISDEVEVSSEDKREWREILDKIVNDINPSLEGAAYYKKSINGIIAHANGIVKLRGNHNINSVTSACINRLRRPELQDLTTHPDFEIFVKAKVADLFNKKK